MYGIISKLGASAVKAIAQQVIKKGVIKGLKKAGKSTTFIKNAEKALSIKKSSDLYAPYLGKISIKGAKRFLGDAVVDDLLKIGGQASKTFTSYKRYSNLTIEQALQFYSSTLTRKTSKVIAQKLKSKKSGLERVKKESVKLLEEQKVFKKEQQKERAQIRYANKRIQELGQKGREIQSKIRKLENNIFMDIRDIKKQKAELIKEYQYLQQKKRKYIKRNDKLKNNNFIDEIEWETQQNEYALIQHRQGQVNLSSSLRLMSDSVMDNIAIKGELLYYSNLVMNMTGQEFSVFMQIFNMMPNSLTHYLYSSDYQDDLLQYDIENIRSIFTQWSTRVGYSQKLMETNKKRYITKTEQKMGDILNDKGRQYKGSASNEIF